MESKGLKVLVHASAFFAPLLVPFIIFLVSTDEAVKRLSIQAILFQFVMIVAITISAFLVFILIGIPLLIILGIAGFVIPIIGIVKALQGETYYYPIVREWI